MHDFLLAIILGIIEGLTEFLPVSSTAHLRIAQEALKIANEDLYWKMFAVVIQLGAIAAVPLYFRRRIAEFLSSFPGERGVLRHPVTLVTIAFVVTAIPSFLLTKVIGENLEKIGVMAWSLIIGGVVMFAIDLFVVLPRSTEDMAQMSMVQAIWIGLCQVLAAVFPGTSRSMATIAGGQLVGMTRPAALEFSFFLSIPTMAAATGYDLLKAVMGRGGDLGRAPANTHEWITLGIGFLVSFVVAYVVVAWFMRWVRSRSFVYFAMYRILFGGFVLWWGLR